MLDSDDGDKWTMCSFMDRIMELEGMKEGIISDGFEREIECSVGYWENEGKYRHA